MSVRLHNATPFQIQNLTAVGGFVRLLPAFGGVAERTQKNASRTARKACPRMSLSRAVQKQSFLAKFHTIIGITSLSMVSIDIDFGLKNQVFHPTTENMLQKL
jgi:hypothetical protein